MTDSICTLCGEEIIGTIYRTKEDDYVCETCMKDVEEDEQEAEEENEDTPYGLV